MKVSVIIPYNIDRGFLQQAIDSVQAQTYRDFEIILSQSEGTGGYNMNRGIEKATGDLLCYLCEDDLLPANSLSDRVEAMEDYDFIHCRGVQFWEEYDKSQPWQLTNSYAELNSMLVQNGIMGGTTMYRRELFDEFMWDEDLWTGGEYDFHLKLLHNNKRLGFCDRFVYKYRRHSLQKSLGNTSAEYQNKRREQVELIRNRYRI
jgi:glycosyltransferase involved in cell wall biosynthesis